MKTLEKDDLAGDSLKLMPPQYLPLLYRGELLRNDTSGSTGKCLEVYWKKEDYMRSMYSLWFYRKKFYGINPWDKRCRFYTLYRVGSEEEKSRQTNNSLEFSKSNLTGERLLEIYDEMLEYQPVWMILQPCIAELLCMIKQKNDLPEIDSLRYIEMTGEELTNSLKDKIKSTFHCQVANQYGANEVNSIAYECPEGNLHCMEDNVQVDILDDDGNAVPDGQCGNIYVTTLHNHVMPFERYGIGDLGCVEKNTCRCGHHGKILTLKSGRKDDWIQMKNGDKVTPYVFTRAIDVVNMSFEHCIFQFQIIQEDYEKFRVKLAVDEKPDELIHYFIQCIGHDELKKAEYEFVFYEALFPEFNGKRSYFKCEIGND